MSEFRAQPHRVAFGGLIALAAAMGIGRFIYTPILPPMVEGLSLSKGEAGLIASANFVGYLAGALAVSFPRLPGSSRHWLLWSLAISALSTGAMGLASSLAAFLLLRFIGGVASAFALVLASTLVLEALSEARRSNLSAVHFGGVGAGIALSALITWSISAFDGDWRAMWLGGGVFSLLALVAVITLIPEGRKGVSAPAPATSETGRSRIWPLVIAYGLFGFGYIITATFIVAIVRGAPEIRNVEPFVWLAVGLAALPSVAAWAALGRRYGVIRAFAVACVVEALGVVASVVWITIPGIFLAAVFLGGTFMGITALGLVAARELSGANPRRVLATMTAAFGVGQIIGPLVAGYGFDLTGSFLLPSCVAAAGLCASAALAHMVKRA